MVGLGHARARGPDTCRFRTGAIASANGTGIAPEVAVRFSCIVALRESAQLQEFGVKGAQFFVGHEVQIERVLTQVHERP